MKAILFDEISSIRKILSNIFILNELLKNKKSFNKCYASLDLLEDTECAIKYYKDIDFETDNYGQNYILIYGLFEAFYIQTQAVECLLDALRIGKNIAKTELDILFNIREIRHDIAGHPACRDDNKPNYSVYLSQPSLSKEQIMYRKSDNDSFITINVLKEIEQQEENILKILKKTFEHLKREERRHYLKYKDKKITEIFDDRYIYYYGKIFNEHDFEFALNGLQKILQDFKNELNKRYTNWQEMNSVSLYIKDIDEIFTYLNHEYKKLNIDDDNIAFIKKNIVENLKTKFDNLIEVAKEIDMEYQKYFKNKKNKKVISPSITFIDFPEKNI